ncbi:RsmB/NOP family class I SAM-dependent RNA methyltransferase [Paenibacillus abyssi]|uniref:Methylase n=1 Tax=Paenibacillus abyssi TaxID=1340531 RepID=A0A917FZI7_9BACL|nr:RsmB/NOP family class I SAM-dependent RNA methyltransferase [Paenibacillus abyssi]GGG15253.1 methylase [Paenibacillus abyssi]
MQQQQLPIAYIKQMRSMLVDEADLFLKSYEAPRTFGLRINPLKMSIQSPEMDTLHELFHLEPVPWCGTGFYYEESTRPGKHPYHAAGLYYIQEPSAMSAVEFLDPQPGETILDLAAAPGGKTTQIAGRMQGQGLLIANEIHPSRAKILSENVERLGIVNAVVTNAAPDELSRRFPAFFDRIMLDAPCSGEGMFRKDPGAIEEWSEQHVAMCAARQVDILEHTAILLKPGGRLTYSTCTFNRAENEEAMEAFVRSHPEFHIERMERIWPHLEKGEGHFVAVLRKTADRSEEQADSNAARASHAEIRLAEVSMSEPAVRGGSRQPRGRTAGRGTAQAGLSADLALLRAFAADALPGFALGPGEPLRFGDALYWLPRDAGSRFGADALHGMRVLRPGLHLGMLRKNRFEPAHALALAASAQQAAWVQAYRPEAPEVAAFLRGETLPAQPGASGWGLVAADGHPLGWGKASGGQIKNHLPKGLRWF